MENHNFQLGFGLAEKFGPEPEYIVRQMTKRLKATRHCFNSVIVGWHKHLSRFIRLRMSVVYCATGIRLIVLSNYFLSFKRKE